MLPATTPQRDSAASMWNLELEPPPQPVPRRKRPFIVPHAAARPVPPPREPVIVLDGFVMLEACRVEDPEDAEKAVLEGCGISEVICEDLTFFRKLTHLDLGDNHVMLHDLAYLPALKELHVDCNGARGTTPHCGTALPPCPTPALCHSPSARRVGMPDPSRRTSRMHGHPEYPPHRLPSSQYQLPPTSPPPPPPGLTHASVPMGGFPCLEVLNLSFNGLGSEAVLALADLPVLRLLDLTKNELAALPADMTGFAQLQTLNCDDNRLGGRDSLWTSLATLPNLTALSLARNRIVTAERLDPPPWPASASDPLTPPLRRRRPRSSPTLGWVAGAGLG